MTSPVVTVQVSTPLEELVALFEERSISGVPVLEGDRLVGVVSTTDVVRSALRDGASRATAGSLMSSPPLVTAPGDALDEAARRLVAGRVHRLVVTEGDRAVGMLSARDVLAQVVHRRLTTPISEIMTTPVETVELGAPTSEAIRALASANVHGLVVVDGMAPVGVFTHREALAARKLPPDLKELPVEEVMSYETICLDVSTPIFRAAAYGVAMNVRRFLAVEHRHLVGVLSSVDLVGVLARAPA